MSVLSKLRERFSNKAANALKLAREYFGSDSRRSQTENLYSMTHKIIEPEWDYPILFKWATYNSVLRSNHEALIKEATRNSGSVQPRFMRKCPSCGNEFQTRTETCPDCNVQTDRPDIQQKAVLEAFVDDPNRTDEIIDVQVSCFRYMLSLSDWYVSIQRADYGKLSPLTCYVEDATKMRVVGDKHGNLGNDEWFCPRCTGEHPTIHYNKGGRCGFCGNTELKETAYIYLDGEIKGRWAVDEMLHGKLDPNLPSLYGLSREVSLLTVLSTLQAMDQFNLDTYTEGKLGNIIVFEGLNQNEVNELAVKAKEQQNKPEFSLEQHKWIVKKLKTLLLGSGGKGGVTNVPAMPELEKMQSLDWWRLWRELVGAVYGAQDVTTGAMKEGTTGQNPRMKLDVNNNTVEALQRAWEDPFNNFFCPLLGVTDWVYTFNPLEEKDEAQEQAILSAKLDNIKKAVDLGYEVDFTDEGEVIVSGKAQTLEERQVAQMERFKQQAQANPQFEGDKPFKKENVFANEKGERIKSKHVVLEMEVEKKDE